MSALFAQYPSGPSLSLPSFFRNLELGQANRTLALDVIQQLAAYFAGRGDLRRPAYPGGRVLRKRNKEEESRKVEVCPFLLRC